MEDKQADLYFDFIKRGRKCEGGLILATAEVMKLRAELAAMTADRDSEQRWANQYHQEAEKLQAELDKARAILIPLEWDDHYLGRHGYCPYCNQTREDGHMSECKINAVLHPERKE